MPPKRTHSGATKECPHFDKAKTLFVLQDNPERATEQAWDTYTVNRVKASKRFEPLDDDDEREDDEEDAGRPYEINEAEVYTVITISRALEKLEKDLGLKKNILLESYRVLSCYGEYFMEDKPRECTTHTRLYSPTKPVYVDVYMAFIYRHYGDSAEWSYKLGFKVYQEPALEDYHPEVLEKFSKRSPSNAFNADTWYSIAYAFFDDKKA
ncbi:hypothetical protein CPB83DRAFT_843060 [Crepidotus variabilis]|uniref:Uncharacterized protein n=1 Tax=Crepidotus variabilis TaxID=179855 RepID=A0A9P6JVU7_9AGAR|nr:hypothetical protein CPB83DRAFT_843060 [Crepidotus variabilis]